MTETRPFRVEQLIAVAEVFHSVTRAQILRADVQSQRSKLARGDIARALSAEGYVSTQIARWLNYRDHTTVLHLIGRVGARGRQEPKPLCMKPGPDRHPQSFVAVAGEFLRKRWAAEACKGEG